MIWELKFFFILNSKLNRYIVQQMKMILKRFCYTEQNEEYKHTQAAESKSDWTYSNWEQSIKGDMIRNVT